jgi:uncharacterized membrane protein
MVSSPYLEMTFRICVFALWSSGWPRRAVKSRLEPLVGFRAYRMFYNIGTIGLLVWAYAFLIYKSPETPELWNFRGYVWFKPLIYLIEGFGVFFLASLMQFGLSFWGLKCQPKTLALHTNGFYKITRHPLYWSVFCLFFGHMLVMGTGLAVLFFVLMELYNVVGVMAFENRALARQFGPAFEAFHASTSTVPFVSLLRGRVTLSRGELPLRWIAGSVVFTLVVAVVHDALLVRSFTLLRPVLDGFGS